MWVLFHFVVASSALWASPHGAPREARDTAQEYLGYAIDRATRDPSYFHKAWGVELSGPPTEIQLATAFSIHVMRREQVVAYALSSDLLPTKYQTFLAYGFPVEGTEFLGTIKVFEKDGAWRYLGRSLAPGNLLHRYIASLRHEYPTSEGYSVSMLETSGIGVFILLYKDDRVVALAPAVIYQRSVFQNPRDVGYEMLDISVGATRLKEEATNFAAKWTKEQGYE